MFWLRYWFLLCVKYLVRLFYKVQVIWIGSSPTVSEIQNVRLICVLNHTTLYEFLLIGGTPNALIKLGARGGVVPVADVTMERPFVSWFLRLFLPHLISVTRKRDKTWTQYIESVKKPNRVAMIFPEGRMMRSSGLDKTNFPMTVRGGIADLLQEMNEGKLLIVYSGGLHHIQRPGEHLLPHLFRPIRMGLEMIDIAEYKNQIFSTEDSTKAFKIHVVNDLQRRKVEFTPKSEFQYPQFEDPFV